MLVREVYLVRWYVGKLVTCSPLIERLYTRTQVIHGCRRSGVSTLVRWYTRDMQSFNRTLVHNDAGHSWLSENRSGVIMLVTQFSYVLLVL